MIRSFKKCCEREEESLCTANNERSQHYLCAKCERCGRPLRDFFFFFTILIAVKSGV